jgi:hypothetical protein
MGVVLMGDNWTRDTKGGKFRIFHLYYRPSVRCWLESSAGSGGSAESSLASSDDGPNRHLHTSLSPPQRADEPALTAFVAGLCAALAELFSGGETTDYRHCSEESAGFNK